MGLKPGATISLVISDPFELSQTLECEVVGIESFRSGAEVETILVRMSSPLQWKDRDYEYLALRGRQAPGVVDELELGFSVECGGIGVDESKVEGLAPWGYDLWRGGLALRMSVRAS